MLFPKVEAVILADYIREEPFAKCSILGFYGVLPNVRLHLQDIEKPALLSFLVIFAPETGVFQAKLMLREAGGRVVSQSDERVIRMGGRRNLLMINGATVTFGREGAFELVVRTGEQDVYVSRFEVGQGSAEDFRVEVP